jgi:outer membrane protein assembly factor BamB
MTDRPHNAKSGTGESSEPMTRRAFCGTTAAAIGTAFLMPEMIGAALASTPALPAEAGSWQATRQNRQLTGIQPLPGKMKRAPKIGASLSFPRGQGYVTAIASKPGGEKDRAIVLADGRLRCYDLDGKMEFVFGTSHGELYALADEGSRGRVVWKAKLPAGVGSPVLADVDNDGEIEIIVALGDGRLCVLSG